MVTGEARDGASVRSAYSLLADRIRRKSDPRSRPVACCWRVMAGRDARRDLARLPRRVSGSDEATSGPDERFRHAAPNAGSNCTSAAGRPDRARRNLPLAVPRVRDGSAGLPRGGRCGRCTGEPDDGQSSDWGSRIHRTTRTSPPEASRRSLTACRRRVKTGPPAPDAGVPKRSSEGVAPDDHRQCGELPVAARVTSRGWPVAQRGTAHGSIGCGHADAPSADSRRCRQAPALW